MKEKNLVSVFVGSGVRTRYLEAVLSQNSISSIMRNELAEASHGGFGGPGTDDSCELFVEQQDYDTAEKIIFEFVNSKVEPKID